MENARHKRKSTSAHDAEQEVAQEDVTDSKTGDADDGDEEDDCVVVDDGSRNQKEEEDNRTPEIGMVFKSYEEVSNFYKTYALRVGFAVTVLKSSFTDSGACRRLVLACAKAGPGRRGTAYKARVTAKTDCPAMVVLRMWDDGLLHLVDMMLEHNHAVSPSAALCYKRMYTKAREDGILKERARLSLKGHREDGVGSPGFRRNLSGKGLLKFGDGDCDAIVQFLASMQAKNPNFFYLVDLDATGRFKNLFWADARSRSAYRYFGDVVSFDTICLIDKSEMPLVLFVGVNHHGQLVLFGCALLSEESIEVYTWLFKAWLMCMQDCPPKAIITDHGKAIQDAVVKVFPGVRHRICLSHIIKKFPEKLKGNPECKVIQKALKRAIFDTSGAHDFEEEWKKVIDSYELDGEEWLNSLYQDRHSWHPVFIRDTFWAGLSMYKCNDDTNSFFEGNVSSRTSISHFLSKYEFFLESKYKKEIQSDIDSYLKQPLLVSKFYMEEQIAKLYTISMFKHFQEELKATMYCHASLVKVDGPVSTFEVQECSYIEDGKQTEASGLEVTYNANKLEVQCICGSFQFSGILCRHAITVFKIHQVFEIPAHYVLDRWRRDFKQLHASSRTSNKGPPNSSTECYDNLTMRFLGLVEIGMTSDDRYRVAVQLVGEMEKSLESDSARKNDQPGIPLSENQSQEKLGHFATAESVQGSKSSNTPSSGKKRGRPSKQQRESSIEPNKEKGFLRSSLVENENNVLQAAATVTHLDAHSGVHGGINLMEDVNPTDLSFGSHFGLQVDSHHHHHQQQHHHHHQQQQQHQHQQQQQQQHHHHHQQQHHQQHVVTPTRPQAGSLVQAHYDQQTPGSQARMQWFYNQMLQEDQIQKAPAGWRIG